MSSESSSEASIQHDSSGGQTSSAEPVEPTLDEAFEALSNRRRRYSLYYLQRRATDGPVELSDISVQVAAWELGTDPDALSYEDRKNVHTSLYQFHAPKLEELGFVTYDQRSGVVELTRHGRQLEIYPSEDADETPWSNYLLAAAGISGLFAFGVMLDGPVVSAVPDRIWTLGIALFFVGTSATFAYAERRETSGTIDGPPPEVDDD